LTRQITAEEEMDDEFGPSLCRLESRVLAWDVRSKNRDGCVFINVVVVVVVVAVVCF
jgi:hypothetical protein